MTGKKSTLTDRERTLTQLLAHTLDCFDPKCRFCLTIERDLEDGQSSFAGEYHARLENLEEHLQGLLRQARAIADFLETTSLPISARRASYSMVHGVEHAIGILERPLTKRDEQPTKRKPLRKAAPRSLRRIK